MPAQDSGGLGLGPQCPVCTPTVNRNLLLLAVLQPAVVMQESADFRQRGFWQYQFCDGGDIAVVSNGAAE